jgi:antitoxin component of MazEF toxin-antitoxin module
MIKKITTIGDSHALVLDPELMNLIHLRNGDEINIEVNHDGSLTLVPIRMHSSRDIVFDPTLMELADLNFGDEMDVDVYEGGTLMLTPIRSHQPPRESVIDVIRSTMKDYVATMKQLA